MKRKSRIIQAKIPINSIQDNLILERSFQDWITSGERDVNYKIDNAYSINFKVMVQYRTQNAYRQRYNFRSFFPGLEILQKKKNRREWSPKKLYKRTCALSSFSLIFATRHVKRVLFRWYWKDDTDKWIPYSEEHSVAIERALVTNNAEVEIDVDGTRFFFRKGSGREKTLSVFSNFLKSGLNFLVLGSEYSL
jgi:hypothetical protein